MEFHLSKFKREYQIWKNMISRCSNPEDHRYHDYGGRGIFVCSEWRTSFHQFLSDLGPRPSPEHSLDRKENDQGYDPKNCRWATVEEQMSNRRGNVKVTFDGKTQTIAQWTREKGFKPGTLLRRFRYGWPPEEMFRPVDQPRRFTKLLKIGNESRPVSEWSAISGISIETLRYRLNAGWESEKLLQGARPYTKLGVK